MSGAWPLIVTVMDGTALHKIRSHCGQFASVRHASALEHCVALGASLDESSRSELRCLSTTSKRSTSGRARVRKQATTTPSRPAKRSSAVETSIGRGGGGEERASTANPAKPEIC